MKISTIQIKNFRSIKEAKISLGDMTVLLGKNNEGKSNLLMAVNVAISTLQIYGELRRRRMVSFRFDSTDEFYQWERDYPISEQKGRKRDKKTLFVLEFVLDEKEIDEPTFRGSRKQETLDLRGRSFWFKSANGARVLSSNWGQ